MIILCYSLFKGGKQNYQAVVFKLTIENTKDTSYLFKFWNFLTRHTVQGKSREEF